jgi:RNA polymerase sigma factor FliA
VNTRHHISPPSLSTLWKEYARNHTPDLRRQLAIAYMQLVRMIAIKFAPQRGGHATMLEHEDIVQFGVLGLLDAIDKFDPTRGIKFESYATMRIQGSIQDELRKLDWVPRSVRQQVRAEQSIDNPSSHRQSTAIAARLALSVESYNELMQRTLNMKPDFDAHDDVSTPTDIADVNPNPLEQATRNDLKDKLLGLIERLPNRERIIVALYYYEELTFREIGKILHLSESRTSQIHATILKELRQQLDT